MTIAKLREMIEDLPDDARIYADDGYEMFEGNSEFVCLVTDSTFPNKIVLQSKDGIDVSDELSCMADIALDQAWSDQDYYTEAYERGFMPEDFDDPDVAESNMKQYGII